MNHTAGRFQELLVEDHYSNNSYLGKTLVPRTNEDLIFIKIPTDR
jgi:hypothetical protein